MAGRLPRAAATVAKDAARRSPRAKIIDSLSYFTESVAVAGPFLLGAVVLVGAGVWLAKRMNRGKDGR